MFFSVETHVFSIRKPYFSQKSSDAMCNRAKALKDEVNTMKKLRTKENRKVAKRESYRASQEAKKQASQGATQDDSQQDPSQQEVQAGQRSKRDSTAMHTDQVKQIPSKRSRHAAYVIPQEQQRRHVNAAVQTDIDSEEEEEAPKHQQDMENPTTPPPKRKGRKKKQQM